MNKLVDMKFELHEDAEGQWHWRLVDKNKDTVTTGDKGYPTQSKARQAVKTFRHVITSASIVALPKKASAKTSGMGAYIHKKYKEDALEILYYVKSQIENEHSNLICYVLDVNHVGKSPNEMHIKHQIKKYISDSLGGPRLTYEQWLSYKLGRDVKFEECKRGRLAWIDRMIQEVKNV